MNELRNTQHVVNRINLCVPCAFDVIIASESRKVRDAQINILV